MGLIVSEKKLALFNDMEAPIKSHFTKTYNNMNISSVKNKKSKGPAAPAPPGSGFGSKFDPDI
jgi:hypothetical protein